MASSSQRPISQMSEEELGRRIREPEGEIDRRRAERGDPERSRSRNSAELGSHPIESNKSGSRPVSQVLTENSTASLSHTKKECSHCEKHRKNKHDSFGSWNFGISDGHTNKVVGGWDIHNHRMNAVRQQLGFRGSSSSWASTSGFQFSVCNQKEQARGSVERSEKSTCSCSACTC